MRLSTPLQRTATVLACLAPALALALAQAQAQASAETGFRIMADGTGGNCVACHALPGQAGVASTFGPSLDKVGSRHNAQVLRQWVTDARQIKSDTLMPPFGTTRGTQLAIQSRAILSEEEIGHVVAALQTLR
jgi:sulfur-oxidizing protein SoxX